MDSKNTYILRQLSKISLMPISVYNLATLSISNICENINNLFLLDDSLIDIFIRQTPPLSYYIHVEFNKIFYASIQITSEQYLFIGPICTDRFSFLEKHEFIKKHQLNHKNNFYIPLMDINIFYDYLAIIYTVTTSQYLDITHLSSDVDFTSQISTQKVKKTEIDAENYHHTYSDERNLSEAVQIGDIEKAILHLDYLLPISGKLSPTYCKHLCYTGIACITGCTRAAIKGGANVKKSYAISDKYINLLGQNDNDSMKIHNLIYDAITCLTKLVNTSKKTRTNSNYVEQCKYYIENNYKKEFRLDELAKQLGLSSGYLSNLFSTEESMTLNQYLNKTRISRAENLLKFSDCTILEISNYTGFSSQSYFTQVFKQQTGMTPKQYRNKYQLIEFKHSPSSP